MVFEIPPSCSFYGNLVVIFDERHDALIGQLLFAYLYINQSINHLIFLVCLHGAASDILALRMPSYNSSMLLMIF